MAGASEDTAKLTLQVTGDVEVLSPCEFSLQLRNTRLFHTDGNGNMKTADRLGPKRVETFMISGPKVNRPTCVFDFY